ncbi:MAG: cobalt transporter CbiM [Proteobacteria bacterium]|nr:cobalt transporter CbiM [Pseudomonadota bacterium]
MHISEGILSHGILAGTTILAGVGVAMGLGSMRDKDIPAVGILTAAFFVASLIHVPVGPVSAHLVLNGLLGMILGIRAFPSILVALFLQAMLFQFGGLTTLGANTLNMALPALICSLFLGWMKKPGLDGRLFTLAAFLCGCLSIFLSGIMVGLTLFANGKAFIPSAKIIVGAHVPVMIIEGFLTASCMGFLKKVKPELLRDQNTRTADDV